MATGLLPKMNTDTLPVIFDAPTSLPWAFQAITEELKWLQKDLERCQNVSYFC